MNDFRIPVYHVYHIEYDREHREIAVIEIKHTLTINASFEFCKRVANSYLAENPNADVEIEEWNCGIDHQLYLKGTW